MKLSTAVFFFLSANTLPTATGRSHRIVGGKEAKPGEFPFMVSWHDSLNQKPLCGGSLVAPNLVLTAAHCERSPNGSVRVGSNNATGLYNGDDAPTGDEANVAQQYIHPQYGQSMNDFLILVLDRDIDTVYQPINLNFDTNEPETGDDLTVIGFGTLSSGGDQPDILMEVEVPVVSHEICSKQYDDLNEDVHLCAGFTGIGGKDSCQGDAGGPIFEEINGVTTQVGVVSSGIGCADPGYSGVYARVSGATTWLKSMICNLSSLPKPLYCETFAPTVILPPPTQAPPFSPTPACVDNPIGWYDSDGVSYDCDWYAYHDKCIEHGDDYKNDGKTANEACCACGGGKDTTIDPPNSCSICGEGKKVGNREAVFSFPGQTVVTCGDLEVDGKDGIIPPISCLNLSELIDELCDCVPVGDATPVCVDNPPGWYNSAGATYNCNWYAQTGICSLIGDYFKNEGKTANEACCACGGGEETIN